MAKKLSMMINANHPEMCRAVILENDRVNDYIVENVLKGINSSFYNTGRFSPSKEKGVHHFHNLISDFINTQ